MKSVTMIRPNPAASAMRALALHYLRHGEWRHHGIGVLQCYVVEQSEPEIRLHIWSPLLVKSGIELSGDAHDHRFDMISHVLCGSIAHEELHPVADEFGGYSMLALTHARAAADTQFHGPTTPLPGRFRVNSYDHVIPAGFSYHFPAQFFHRSPLLGSPDQVAITCIEKHLQVATPARLLYPSAREPVMAFGHETDRDLVGSVLVRAIAQLRLAIKGRT